MKYFINNKLLYKLQRKNITLRLVIKLFITLCHYTVQTKTPHKRWDAGFIRLVSNYQNKLNLSTHTKYLQQ